MRAYIEKIKFKGKIAHGRYIALDEIIYEKQSKYQNIVVGKNDYFGRMLILDNAIQFSERDEFIYHEMLVHPAMLLHKNPKDILILGGGDGFALREILKHNIDYVRLIDIDRDVIDASKRYFSDLNNRSFEDKRVDVVIGDAIEYTKNPDKKYDVVFLDLVDPQGDLENDPFFNKSMINLYRNLIKDDGIIVTHAETVEESSNYVALRIGELFRRAFGHSYVYEAFIPSFYYPWNYVIAAKWDIRENIGAAIQKLNGLKTRYINSDVLRRITGKREQWIYEKQQELREVEYDMLFNGQRDTEGGIENITL